MPSPTVVIGTFGKQPMQGLAAELRSLADAVDRGEIEDCVAMATGPDRNVFVWGASLWDSVGLTALLHHYSIDRMRA